MNPDPIWGYVTETAVESPMWEAPGASEGCVVSKIGSWAIAMKISFGFWRILGLSNVGS